MNIDGSEELKFKFRPQDDKVMREIIEQYRQAVTSNKHDKQSKELLFLKKIRLHHPWFKNMQYGSFKMLMD